MAKRYRNSGDLSFALYSEGRMPFTALISTAELAELEQDNLVVIDCRFSLADTDYGRTAYGQGHIPGAHYAHLDDDLSSPVVPGQTGRHPLPEPGLFTVTMQAWGIDDGTQVVAYDDGPGAIAARLWWLVRYHGHGRVAVLDGGFAAWQKEGRPTSRDVPALRDSSVETWATVSAMRADANDLEGYTLVDARAAERYRGEVEPLDPVAGHIPGARSRPFKENIGPDGFFLPPDELRARFEGLGRSDKQVHYCGSGVTGAHNLLAMAAAGLPGARLYPGSWSEWITDPARPVVTGQE